MARIKGIDRLKTQLHKLDKDIQGNVKVVVDKTLSGIEYDARKNLDAVPHSNNEGMAGLVYNAAVDLRKVITYRVSPDGLSGKVEVGGGETAAYLEFGTGQFAAHWVPMLPKEWQATAKTFYKNGKGKIPAYPYLYPAYQKHTAEFVKRLREALREAVK